MMFLQILSWPKKPVHTDKNLSPGWDRTQPSLYLFPGVQARYQLHPRDLIAIFIWGACKTWTMLQSQMRGFFARWSVCRRVSLSNVPFAMDLIWLSYSESRLRLSSSSKVPRRRQCSWFAFRRSSCRLVKPWKASGASSRSWFPYNTLKYFVLFELRSQFPNQWFFFEVVAVAQRIIIFSVLVLSSQLGTRYREMTYTLNCVQPEAAVSHC